MACTNLCTAQECFELRQLIVDLQSQINFLTNQLYRHTLDPIPQAHAFEPEVTVNPTLTENQLTIEVAVDKISSQGTVELPEMAIETVAVEIDSTDEHNQIIKVLVNEVEGQNTLIIPEPELDFAITNIAPGTFNFHLILGEQESIQQLVVNELAIKAENEPTRSLDVKLSYLFNFLTVTVSDGVDFVSDTVYINAGTTINQGSFGGGGSGSNGGDKVDCQGVADALETNLDAILAAIKAVDGKVNTVKDFVTIEIEGEAIGDLACPIEGEKETDTPKEIGVKKEYKAKGLSGLWELLKILNDNQVSVFEATCEQDNIVAFPSWWQVRLGAKVPQIVCSFRKAKSRTYHSLSIPHPANTNKPKGQLLPAYTKGNWQGIITCIDNSKFIINCQTQAEAERMCSIAAQLIDNNYLELPPRIYVGERKGQAVSVDSMTPSTIEFFETGQQNLIPNWRVRVSDFEKI